MEVDQSPQIHTSEAQQCSSVPGVLSQFLSPHVQREESQGQEIQCHQALLPSSALKEIKCACAQPGQGPRVKCFPQNKIKTKQCHGPIIPTEGAHAPLREGGSLQVMEVTSEQDVHSPLAARTDRWRACAVHPWVLSTVSQGYRLQFAMKPPRFNGVLVSVARGDSARVLEGEIASLLNKQAIRAVPS